MIFGACVLNGCDIAGSSTNTTISSDLEEMENTVAREEGGTKKLVPGRMTRRIQSGVL